MSSTVSCYRLIKPTNCCLFSRTTSSKLIRCHQMQSCTRRQTTKSRESPTVSFVWSKSPITRMTLKNKQSMTDSQLMVGCILRTNVVTTFLKRPTLQSVSFSTIGNAVPSTSKTSQRWKYIARIIRYVRIPVLVLSVYSIGYQQGVIDCIQAPDAIQDQILASLLLSVGIKTIGSTSVEYKVIHERDVSILTKFVDRNYQVAAVAHRIIQSGQKYVQDELNSSMAKVNAALPTDIDPKDANAILDADEDVKFWYSARLRLEGEHVMSKQWKYVLINSPEPNAFVSELLPHHLFITTGMLQLATNADELAFVLGHEVSHLILGHVSASNQIETWLRTLEVLLLSLDPTAGLLSLFFISGLYVIRRAISSSYSREHELQADELGVIISARACFNTVSGVNIMNKLYEHNVGIAGNTGKKVSQKSSSSKVLDNEEKNTNNELDILTSSAAVAVQLLDTHPPTIERYERLKLMVHDGAENYPKYSHCASITRLYNAFSWNKKN